MSSLKLTPVTIVLPMYKPPRQWSAHFLKNMEELDAYLPVHMLPQYVVVYDGMPDRDTLCEFRKVYERHKRVRFTWYDNNRGKGFALRCGVNSACSPLVLTMDFDFPYRKESVAEMIRLLQQGYDVIVGKRSTGYYRQIPLKRKVISRIFSWLASAFLGLSLKDTQSGIKGFNERGRAAFLETTIDRFLVDTEFILRASKKNLSIRTIQIEPKADLSFTNFGMGVIKTESLNFIKLLYLNRSLTRTA